MIVPLECDLWEEYNNVRGLAALEAGKFVKIAASGQPCKTFGVYNALAHSLHRLYSDGDLAFLNNIGSLAEPIADRAEFKLGKKAMCTGLFSHNDQQRGAQTLTCEQKGAPLQGLGGRIADELASGASAIRAESFSIAGTAFFPQGVDTEQQIIHASRGAVPFNSDALLEKALHNITGHQYGNAFSNGYAQQWSTAVTSSADLNSLLLSASVPTEFGSDALSKQFVQVAKIVSTRAVRKVERDVFFVAMNGYDNHNELHKKEEELWTDVNAALVSFVVELKRQGVWSSTVIVAASDFGRTLTSNGKGTDHAWAGNYFIAGGGVNGGQMVGSYPSSLLEGSKQDIGRGRLIPRYPWESIWVPVAKWMGLENSQIQAVFPNLHRFNVSRDIFTT